MTFYDVLTEIFQSIDNHLDGKNNILPTSLFNEGWMLRLTLNWFSKNRKAHHRILFDENAKWFSEGRLETIFKNEKGAKIGENYTEADGVFGNIIIGTQGELGKPVSGKAKGISDIRLEKNCRQFVTIEAKIFSSFSKGVTNDKKYTQPARYIACMSYVLFTSSGLDVNNIKDIAFYTFLPKHRIRNTPSFKEYTNKEHIKEKVKNRLQMYFGHSSYPEKERWFNDAFLPFLEKITIDLITWEDILDHIKSVDKDYFEMLDSFYSKCRRYNDRVPGDVVDLSLQTGR